VFPTFGGHFSSLNYSVDNTHIVGFFAVSTGNLTFTPASTFDGTITNIILQQVVAGSEQLILIEDNAPNPIFAIRSTTPTQSNVIVGVDAGKFLGANDIGVNNICFGFRAGEHLTTGDINVMVGADAGNSLSCGRRNVCIGSRSGFNITAGQNNILIGQQAGSGITTGIQNFCMGVDAGGTLTTQSNNVFIGHGAGLTAAAGNNVGIGLQALTGATGGFNTAVGDRAGLSITTGNNSTFLGDFAGNNASQLASVTNSTAIGNSSYTTASNQIMVGNSAITQTILRGTVDVARSTNPCRVNVYNTAAADPPGTSFELVAMRWDSDVAKIGTHAGGGGGTARALALETNSVVRLTLNADGTVLLNTYANLPTTEPTTGTPGTLWLDPSDSNSAILKVTTS
jgi:hypothetical protein